MLTDKSSIQKNTDSNWPETKHEYEVVDGTYILKRITKEKKKFEWYNSSIFLWFLGVLFLTFLPWIWTTYQASKEKDKRVERIDSEISGRFNQLFDKVRRLSDSLSANNSNKNSEIINPIQVNVKDMFGKFRDPPKETYGNIKFYPSYMEFEDYSMITLLNQLASLLEKESDKLEIRAVIEKVNYPDFIPTTSNLNNEQIIQSIKKEMYLKRWQN